MQFQKIDFSKVRVNKIQKKQAMVLGGLFCLLLLTGYLNFKFNSNTSTVVNNKKADSTVSSQLPEHNQAVSASSGSFFSDFRIDRERIREKELASIESVINDENTNKQVLAQAQEQKMKVSSAMEKEITLEGLLKAKGFSDAVVTIRENSVNVVVEEAEIDEKKAAQILEIVQRETGEDSSNIKVLPKG